MNPLNQNSTNVEIKVTYGHPTFIVLCSNNNIDNIQWILDDKRIIERIVVTPKIIIYKFNFRDVKSLNLKLFGRGFFNSNNIVSYLKTDKTDFGTIIQPVSSVNAATVSLFIGLLFSGSLIALA